jgi:PAS domain-containing protein
MKNLSSDAGASSSLRGRAEAQFRAIEAMSQEKIDSLSPESLRTILHELRVHQIELEMQNEELRRAQEDLAASRGRYFDLYDLAPVGYITVSEAGIVLEANLTAATLFGMGSCRLGEAARFPAHPQRGSGYFLRAPPAAF